MARIARERSGVKVNEVLAETLAEVRAEVSGWLGEELGQALEAKVDSMLGREAYARRKKVAGCAHQMCVTAASDRPLTGLPVLPVDAIRVAMRPGFPCHNVAHTADLWWRLRLWALFLLGGFSSVPM